MIASGRKSGGVNRDVGEKARKLLQEWAAAFKGSGKKELEGSELVEAFERLRREGIEFPTLDKQASAAMVESLSVRPSFLILSRSPTSSHSPFSYTYSRLCRPQTGSTRTTAPAAAPPSAPSTANTTAATAAKSSTRRVPLKPPLCRTMESSTA